MLDTAPGRGCLSELGDAPNIMEEGKAIPWQLGLGCQFQEL
jgi:hypothetical protein